SSPQQIYGIRSTTYPSYALNLAQLGGFVFQIFVQQSHSVLSLVAHELSNSFNKHQIKGGVFRKGGEEFVVVSNTNNEEFAYYLAEDLRRAVESIDIKGIEEKVTISIGVAYCENGHGDEAIKTADTHMRDAKSSGKNTIRPEIDDLPRILEKYALKKIYA
ncbi:GGDEF domain-containing protein, partial [Acinetobacter baumannii]|uniref:GGDEF domain-containing protein n=1 Tax=Acinetobacter baumannii TaxID=470 RepID=UPI003892A06D